MIMFKHFFIVDINYKPNIVFLLFIHQVIHYCFIFVGRIMLILLTCHFVINFLIITAHSIGLFLLRNVKASENFPEIQRFLLIQLSGGELVCGLLFLADDIIILINHHGVGNLVLLGEVKLVVVTLINIPTFTLFVITMLVITVDRFLYVYLNIRYPLVCTLRRIKILVRSIQSVLTLFSLLIMVFHRHTSSINAVAKFSWPLADALFLTVAITTYSYLFKKIRENRKIDYQISSRVNSEGENNLQSNLEAQSSIKKKNLSMKSFITLAVLILSFFVFIVLPDEVLFWHRLFNAEVHEQLYETMKILFKLGYLSDAIIYIFLQKEIFRRAKAIVLQSRTTDTF